jgi:copper resistance protein B
MTRVALFLAGTAVLAFAAPAAAQSMDHTSMPGMTMPSKPAPTAGMDHGEMPGMEIDQTATDAPACSPEHAAMGHCTPDPEASTPAEDAAAAADQGCPPEHAKMGHCTPRDGATNEPPPGATGTDLAPGDALAPAPPSDWYADRIYSAGEMEHSRHEMMKENGAQTIAFISFNLAEYQARKGGDGFRWDGEGWYGGDINRITIKSEGEGVFGEGIEGAELQMLYSRAVGPYFNAQAGIRQDLGAGPDRTYATIGFEGLAPYWFEVEGALFLSNKGDILGRVEGYYDQRITQKLILQPMAELNFSAQDVPETGTGSGLSDVELGLRLRYEIVKEFAPYVGLEWARKFGDTARFARAAGEDPGGLSFVMGVRAWF